VSANVSDEPARDCPSADLAVWQRHQAKVRETDLPIMRELFLRLCEAAQARGVPWRARVTGDTIGFRASGDSTFRVALHANPKNKLVYEPPSILIHPSRPLSDIGVPDPYPELRSFWVAQFSAHGWSVPTTRDIPGLAAAVELALAHGRS
jgi:hypothetical protein